MVLSLFLTGCALGKFELSSGPTMEKLPTCEEIGGCPEDNVTEEIVEEPEIETSSTVQDYEMPEVKVYSTAYCPHCDSVKSFLQQNGIDFEEIDIEDNPAAAEGINYVPVTEIGNERVIGWNEQILKELLNIG